MENSQIKVALIGNPNSGKSSLFNELTGLRQKVGNFAGVTIDKKSGVAHFDNQGKKEDFTVIDFPGLYSVYPKSEDERIVMDVLANPVHPDYPDVAVVVVDASNLKRNLLLYSEVADMKIPIVMALNMVDVASSMNIEVNAVVLAKELGIPVVNINARNGEGLDRLKTAIQAVVLSKAPSSKSFFTVAPEISGMIEEAQRSLGLQNPYTAFQYLCQAKNLTLLSEGDRLLVDGILEKHNFDQTSFLEAETIDRYKKIDELLVKAQKKTGVSTRPSSTRKLDQILLHPFWGYVIFLAVLLVVFQAMFSWSSVPMDWIDETTSQVIDWVKGVLPEGLLNDLITDGVLAGIGGVIIFVPQIAFLYLLVGILEESGYMSRVMVLMDRSMRKFGLNGRSVVPLISGVACAVPAIMSTRTISNKYERLVTIMATPLMACAARLPIYTIFIALVVPETKVLGVFNLQGIALLGLYLLGVIGAIFTAWLMTIFVKRKEASYLILELPVYKMPRWNHVGIMVYDSVKAFVLQAGKVIIAISIILWVLATYGPGDSQDRAEELVRTEMATASEAEIETAVTSERLKHSYAGILGHAIEPAIRPLGYDWKMGIALIASFAAREVFVGTVSTIYSIGADDAEEESTVKERLRNEINPTTGEPVYTMATSISLLVFYAFAMMCMSTLAAVYRETNGWKWPMIQLVYTMTLAWGLAFIAYQLLK